MTFLLILYNGANLLLLLFNFACKITKMINILKNIFNLKVIGIPIAFFVGLVLFLWCVFFPFGEDYPKWFIFASKIGEILLISTSLSFFTSAADFMGFFRKNIEDVIYDAKHLERRKDIVKIWVRVSEVLFDSKFPRIRKRLMDTIMKNYLPTNGVVSYSDYKCTYTIEEHKTDPEYIVVKHEINFTLYSADKKEFAFPLRTTTSCCSEEGRRKLKVDSDNIKVNGKMITPKCTHEQNGDDIRYTHEVKLKGASQYFIEQLLIKEYKLEDDNYLGFQAKWLVSGMTIQLFYPEELLKPVFLHRGTSDDFNVKNRKGYLESNYKGLILRRQGYIIILNKK